MRSRRTLVAAAALALLLMSVGLIAKDAGNVTTSAPTVAISASSEDVFIGQPFTLTWSSTNATACTATGAWSGSEPITGRQTETPSAPRRLTYSLTCTGPGGSASATLKVSVASPSLSVTESFSPNSTTISTSEGAPYGDCNFWIHGPANCNNESNLGYGPTKVLRLYICLSGEVSISTCSQQPKVTGPLSSAMLNAINAGIAAYAGSGIRLMVRFTYNFGPIGPGAMDAPIDVISTHIDQLAPIMFQNKDLIFALEAGFIGTWGEWHDSTNGNDTAAAQKIVLDKELSYFNGLFPILVRYPGDLIQYTGSTPQVGLGLHDDYYASNSDDGATWNPCDTGAGYCSSNYTASLLKSYAAKVSRMVMFAGEFGALYGTLQSCSALNHYSYTYHPQSISLFPFPSDIGTELQNEGCALTFYNKVGTRIELQKATIIGDPIANGKLYFALTLVNAGYGRVIRQCPVTLVLLQNGTSVAQIPIPIADMDLRRLSSSTKPLARTFQFEVTLPATLPSGPVTANLLVPDPASSLSSQAAYALPLNSVDQSNNAIFDAATGYNLIAAFNVN